LLRVVLGDLLCTGHVTRACAVTVSDNENVIRYSVLVTQ